MQLHTDLKEMNSLVPYIEDESGLFGISTAKKFFTVTIEDSFGLSNLHQLFSTVKIFCEYALAHEFQIPELLEVITNAIKRQPYYDKRPSWWTTFSGRCYKHLGLLRDAECQFRMVLASGRRVAKELVEIYLLQNETQAALGLIDAIFDESPGELGVYLRKSHIYASLNDNDLAFSSLRAALKLNPSHNETLSFLSAAHSSVLDHEASLQCCYRLDNVRTDRPGITCNLARDSLHCRQLELAVTYARCLLESGHDQAIIWYNNALFAFYAGDSSVACYIIRIILSLHSKSDAILTSDSKHSPRALEM